MEASPNRKEFLTIKELSVIADRSITSLRRDVKRGALEAFQPAGRGGKLLFRRDALEKCKLSAGQTAPSNSKQLPGRRPTWMEGQ
jgi:hypothetical protein